MFSVLSGAMFALSLVAALLFFHAFRRTRDRLFILFGIAFVILGCERLVPALSERPEIDDPLDYVPRIIAFAIIAIAIVDRNRR